MFRRLWLTWWPRFLFRFTVLAAGLLLALVLLSPCCDDGEPAANDWVRALALFARDTAVRRTAAASAIGLLVTAVVFFKPPARSAKGSKLPPPTNVVGA